jgi:hypothetical protein
MIAKIISSSTTDDVGKKTTSFGSDPAGLTAYLMGPGRANEHTNQRVLTGSPEFMWEFAQSLTDPAKARTMGSFLNQPARDFGIAPKSGHVRHIVLALSPEESKELGGGLSDAAWSRIAEEYLDGMGFTDSGGLATTRWAAFHHGVTLGEGDHIHIVTSIARVDGSKVSSSNEFRRSNRVREEIELRHGLHRVGGGLGAKDYARGELESLARRRAEAKYWKEAKLTPGMVPWKMLDSAARTHLVGEQLNIEQPRVELARFVRGAGAGARDEGEYVRRLRGSGLLVRPYFAKGSKEVVAGYSVAMKPVHGERPIWYGGSTLGKDLSLPSLRSGWPENDQVKAVAEWTAAGKNRPFATRDSGAVSGAHLREYMDELVVYLGAVARVDVQDLVQYAQVAREGAGLFAAWSVAAGKEGDENAKALGEASDLFARHAQLSEQPQRAVQPASRMYADLCTHLAISKSRRAGSVAMVRTWTRMGQQLGKAFEAAGVEGSTRRLSTDLRERLDSVHDSYRLINPLPVKTPTGTKQSSQAPASGPVAVLERDAKDLPVAPSPVPSASEPPPPAAPSRAEQTAARAAQMRANGVPEELIKGFIFAQSQQKYDIGQRPPILKPPANKKVTRHDPQRKGPGPDKGISR